MAKDFDRMEDSNRSANPSIHEVSVPQRRTVLQLSLGAAASALFTPWLAGCATGAGAPAGARIGFEGIPIGRTDALTVPKGYVADVIAAWGEPIGVPGHMPAWKPDASNSAADQAVQMGMHHDGIHYYPLDGSRRGLLALNHEYADDGLVHPDGMKDWTAEKTRQSQAAHGVAVIELEQKDGRWQMVRPSR